MMETRLIPKKFLKLIKNLADENRNYKKIFGNVFWLEVVKKKNYNWFNLRLNSKEKSTIKIFNDVSPDYETWGQNSLSRSLDEYAKVTGGSW